MSVLRHVRRGWCLVNITVDVLELLAL